MDDIAKVLKKKIRKRHPKYISKMSFCNIKVEGESNVKTVVNKVTKEYDASSMEELFPEKCEECGHKTVDKNRVIALATVAAVTAHGTRSHPVIDQVLKGYLKTEEKGGQLELEKLLEAASLHESLSATKKKPITAKVNVVKIK